MAQETPELTPRDAAQVVEMLWRLPGPVEDLAEVCVEVPLRGLARAEALLRAALDARGLGHVGLRVVPGGGGWPRVVAVERARRRASGG